jgi:AtzE family amidohydrolase
MMPRIMPPDCPGAAETAQAVRAGSISAVAAIQGALDRIARHDPALNAFTQVTAERAMARAEAIDAMVARGENPGVLAGVPFAAKNLFDVAGVTTLAGSVIERRRAPAARDATAVARLEAAGAICVGCLNMDEYAYGFTTENSHYGATRNPHDTGRTAGGSSGGCGAAVAGGLVPISLGTDTNGSIRVPASLNGIFGLKPTYGRLSRAGSMLFVPSLDHIGPFARSTADLAAAYDAMQGADEADPAQAARAPAFVSETLHGGIGGLRAARLGGHFARHGIPEVQHAATRVAEALGGRAEVVLERAAAARAAAFLITAAEGAQMRLPDLRERADEFEPLTRDRLLAGALIPAQWVLHAQRVRRQFQADLRTVFAQWDILVAPATPTPATPLGQEMLEADGQVVPLRASFGVYTQPISCIGLPVLAVPVQNVLGALPAGVQLIAAPWAEEVLFRAAAYLEQAGLCAAPVAPGFAAAA